MTTIATDGITIAGDTLVTSDGYVCGYATKVFCSEDGRAFGCCGSAVDAIQFKSWLSAGVSSHKFSDNFNALVLNQDRTVDFFGEDLCAVRFCTPFAIGSGDNLAIGAMLAGASPAEAVKIAIMRDTYSGGDITICQTAASK